MYIAIYDVLHRIYEFKLYSSVFHLAFVLLLHLLVLSNRYVKWKYCSAVVKN